MKMKLSVAGLIIATAMIVAVGPIQAACFKSQPGWHMVSKNVTSVPPKTGGNMTAVSTHDQPMGGV